MGATDRGRWAYACSKALDEFMAIAYFNERGVPTMVGPLFNTVGPRQTGRYGMVVPRFVQQALAGDPIHRVRPRAHSADVSVTCEMSSRRSSASSTETTFTAKWSTSALLKRSPIRELAERVRAITGSSSEIVTVPYDEAYSPRV